MPKPFDPVKTKESLLSFSLDFERNTSERLTTDSPTGNFAAFGLSTILEAFLTNTSDQATALIKRNITWLEEAIVSGEWTHDRDAASGDWHQQSLSAALAVHKFLDGQGIDQSSFARAANLTERAWRTGLPPFAHKTIANGQIEYYMPLAYLAGLYDDGIRNFEEYHPGKAPNIRAARSRRDVCYLLCQHKELGMHDSKQLDAAVHRVANVNMASEWLGSGQYKTAAIWLMLAYATQQPELTPQEVILKAYDHMPGIQAP